MRAAFTAGLCLSLFVAGCEKTRVQQTAIANADAARGLKVMREAACGACHLIPGIEWPRGVVGPSLEGFADRGLIAGRFPNKPQILAAWIRDPPALDPQTGMPPSDISEQEARDVAAYLYTLRAG